MADPLPPPRLPMTGWFDPLMLARIAGEVILSGIFGRMADARALSAATGKQGIFDLRQAPQLDADGRPVQNEQGELVLAGDARSDLHLTYVADTGDGWDATATVAWLASRDLIEVSVDALDPAATTYRLPRGSALLFGGDQVYPSASPADYEQRLVIPWRNALPHQDPPGLVFALPGNHDWYDNLACFTRIFHTHRWFGGWFAPQRRSYWTLRLPHGWWIVAVDTQLADDLDPGQLDHFQKVAKEMQADERVVVLLPEPVWIHHASGAYRDQHTLAFLEQRIFPGKVRVAIAGDLHHYRRHMDAHGRQRITCGGGGAFLHPTWDGVFGPSTTTLPPAELARDGVTPADTSGSSFQEVPGATYPSPGICASRVWWNLAFPWFNKRFGLVTAGSALLLTWALRPDVSGKPLLEAAHISLHALVGRPFGLLWAVLILVGWFKFADARRTWWPWVIGTAHGAAQLILYLVLWWLAASLCALSPDLTVAGWQSLSIAGGIIGLGGYLGGGILMGLYLALSYSLLGAHGNEAFSSLRIKDWKNFLHLHVTADALTIYPIGIDRVHTSWRWDAGLQRWLPSGTPPQAKLIEAPIRLRP